MNILQYMLCGVNYPAEAGFAQRLQPALRVVEFVEVYLAIAAALYPAALVQQRGQQQFERLASDLFVVGLD